MGDVVGTDSSDSTDSADQGVEPGRAARAAIPSEPDKTADELDVGWGERPRDPSRLCEDDERLLRERPPHWE